MAQNNFNEVAGALFQGMDGFFSARTVVGEPMTVGDTIIIPLVDVSMGMGAGAALNDTRKSNNGGGGAGAKMSPNAVLVIKDGVTRLVSVKSQDTVNKVLDMVPGVIDRFTAGKTNPLQDEAVTAAVKKTTDNMKKESGKQEK